MSTVGLGETKTETKTEIDEDATSPNGDDVPESVVVRKNRTKKEKVTYQRNWAKYDLSKEFRDEHFEQLSSNLCGLVRQPPYTHGRPPFLVADMVYCVLQMAYSGKARRDVMSLLKSAQCRGLITKAPDSPSTLSRYLEDVALTPVLKHLIMQSALPLWGLDNGVFATDATGFSTRVRGTWLKSKQRKNDKQREKQEGVGEIHETPETEEFEAVNRRQWIKAHCVFRDHDQNRDGGRGHHRNGSRHELP